MAKDSRATSDFHYLFFWEGDFFRVITSLSLVTPWYCLEPTGFESHGAGTYLPQIKNKMSKNKQQCVEKNRNQGRGQFL